MSAAFIYAATLMLADEKGYVNDRYDPGGETKFGISKRSYPDADIPRLTLARALVIYRRDFWTKLRLDEVSSKYIGYEVFDTGVNSGPDRATRILQACLNTVFATGLRVDGDLGDKTLYAVNRVSANYELSLLSWLNTFQGIFYLGLAENNPERMRFLKGWGKRLLAPVELLVTEGRQFDVGAFENLGEVA